MDFDQIDSLQYESDAQVEWWEEHGNESSEEEIDELFEYVVSEEKFSYRELVVKMTVKRIDHPDLFLQDLRRLAPHLDTNGAWVALHNEIRDCIDGNEELAREIYSRLKSDGGGWVPNFAKLFLIELPNEEAKEEILQLLSADDEVLIATGCISLAEGFEDEEVSDAIVHELEQLGRDGIALNPVLKANRALFQENPSLWALTMEIGYKYPESVEPILFLFGHDIDGKHLTDYLELIKFGLEEGSVSDIRDYALSKNFSHKTQQLADFTVWLSDHQSNSANRLAEDIGEANSDFMSALFDRADRFSNTAAAKQILRKAGKSDLDALINELIDHYDSSQRVLYLHLLRDVIGDLYFADSFHQDAAREIAEFIDSTVAHHPFVRDIDWEMITSQPEDDDEKRLQQDVFVHLYNIVDDILNRRDFDASLLQVLKKYPNLESHFRSRLLSNLQSHTYHPMMAYLEKDGDHPVLSLMDGRWDEIPEEKRDALKSPPGFPDILSEVLLILWLEQRGVDYSPDVNLHAYDSGEELNRDSDLLVDGNYIEIQSPKIWTDLRLSNRMVGIPNRSIQKITSKFRNKFSGTLEPNDRPVFIALNLDRSEIMAEEVIASMWGKVQIQFAVDQETGTLVNERPTRDAEQSIRDEHWFTERHLNGVIWYTTQVNTSGGRVDLSVDGAVIPNPNSANPDNQEICEELQATLFD